MGAFEETKSLKEQAAGSADGDEIDDDDEVVLRYIGALQTRAATPAWVQPDERAAQLAAEVEGPNRDEGLKSLLAEGTPGSRGSIAALEPAFVERARRYGDRHRMTYEAWLGTGVDPEVLARAGMGPEEDRRNHTA